jgi:hypothetical protein
LLQNKKGHMVMEHCQNLTSRRLEFATIILLSLLIIAFHSANSEVSRLKLAISLSKNTYLLGECIWIDATGKNIGKDTVRFFGFFPLNHGPFYIEVKNFKGEIIPFSGGTYTTTNNTGWILEPEDEYLATYNLLEQFTTDKGILHHIWGKLPVGKYSVRASYREIQSNELSFEIVEPTGEEKLAYEMLQEGFVSWRRDRDRNTYAEKLLTLSNKYPKSVYAEKALHETFQHNDLLRRFPNSGYSECVLRRTTQMEAEEKKSFLRKIIADYPDTRAAKFAMQMSKEWKK